MPLFNRSKNYCAVFLRREGDKYTVIGKKYFKPSETTVKFKVDKKEKSFVLDLVDLCYYESNKAFLYIDVEREEQLSFQKFKHPVSAEVIDLAVEHNIVASLFGRLNPNLTNKTSVIIFIMALAVGVASGYIFGTQNAPTQIVYKYINQTGNIPVVP